MIHYNSLWETMSNKHFTTYTLREKHNIGHGTVQRLQKNMPVSTYTLDRLCKILDCRLDEVAEYLPDEEMELYCVFTIAVGTAGNFGFPAGALFL